MSNNEIRKHVLKEHLRVISHISDKRYQERVWISGEGPDALEFDETSNQFFDRGDPILEKYKDYSITEKQYQILKKFRDQFEAFCDGAAIKHYYQNFIDTPEWAQIMAMAKEVLKAFNYKKTA